MSVEAGTHVVHAPHPSHAVVEDATYDVEHPAIAANRKYRWEILIALVFSAVLEVMDTSILNVALPQMAGTLGATIEDVAWVSTAYLLSNVVFLPMTAWLSQRYGKKNYLTTCVVVFAISRLLCAFSPSLGFVILWRIVQGAAGAALISTAQAVLVEIFPSERQGMVQALFGIGLVVAPAVAPLMGGWIVDHYSWQAIFYIHVPIAMLSCYLISTMYTDASTPESRRAASKVDGIGVALLAVGLGSLQYVLEEGERYDWFGDVWITRITIMAVVGIAAMVIWELSPSNKSPVVNLRIYGNRGLWSAVLISFMIGVGMYGVNYAFSIFVQNVLGFTPMKTGQAMLPLGTGALISLMIVGVVSNLVDSRILTAIGLLACMTGSWMLGFSSQFTGLDDIWLPLGLVGFGAGGAMMPVMVAAFASLKPSETADGSGQLGLGRQLGGSFGIAIINTYIVRMNDFHRATLLQHLSTTNQTFMQTFRGLTGMMMMHGYHGAAAQQASLGLISQMVALQAMIKANNSAFQLVAMMFACSLLLVFLLKSPKR